jgi:hypothetical protein
VSGRHPIITPAPADATPAITISIAVDPPAAMTGPINAAPSDMVIFPQTIVKENCVAAIARPHWLIVAAKKVMKAKTISIS